MEQNYRNHGTKKGTKASAKEQNEFKRGTKNIGTMEQKKKQSYGKEQIESKTGTKNIGTVGKKF
jgi:hypothetical protein